MSRTVLALICLGSLLLAGCGVGEVSAADQKQKQNDMVHVAQSTPGSDKMFIER